MHHQSIKKERERKREKKGQRISHFPKRKTVAYSLTIPPLESQMEAPSLRVWRDLGVVDTIYEEEDEDDEDSFTRTSSSPPSPLSPVISSPSSPLQSRVNAWSAASGREPDVVIFVQDSSFYLHKAPLRAKSSYLKKRLLKETSELTLSPPLNITAETFSLVTEFCYGAHIQITPFNVAPLRVAADLLGMTESGSGSGSGSASASTDNLLRKTEAYFRHIVSVNREHTAVVLRSSVSLLPEAETTACFVTRCIDALSSMDDGVAGSLDEIIKLPPEDFKVIVGSMNQRFTASHDLLYRIVDLYLKEHKGDITEEQKIRICNYIDCNTLSSELLMHAVQNPRMPLRFVVQAMFIEQLNTRRSIFSAADHHTRTKHQNQNQNHPSEDSATLGAILERDAALRQVAQLKAAMNTTNSRIQSLEKELNGMRKILGESSSENGKSNPLDSVRSQSFRFSSEKNDNRIERGQIGSVSSASLRFTESKDRFGGRVGSNSSSEEESIDRNPAAAGDQKNFGRRLINGLKNAFRVSALISKKKPEQQPCPDSGRFEEDGEGGDIGYQVGKNVDVIVIKKNLPFSHQASTQL